MAMQTCQTLVNFQKFGTHLKHVTFAATTWSNIVFKICHWSEPRNVSSTIMFQLPDEPFAQALGIQDDIHIFEDYRKLYELAIAQRMTLVCFKGGSDKIVGASVVYVVIAN